MTKSIFATENTVEQAPAMPMEWSSSFTAHEILRGAFNGGAGPRSAKKVREVLKKLLDVGAIERRVDPDGKGDGFQYRVTPRGFHMMGKARNIDHKPVPG